MKKRIVVVEPKGADSNVFAKSMKIPLLGPIYVATMAEQLGYESVVINENLLGREVSSQDLEFADVLALSCMTTTIDRGKEIERLYKQIRNHLGLDSWSVVGGIHASMIPEDVVDDFDQVYVGEINKKKLEGILSGDIRDKIVHGERMENLDDLPIPNFKLMRGYEKMKITPVMTSLGCPFDCDPCSVVNMFGKKVRVRSIENVLEELSRYKKGNVFFVDDNLTINPKRLEPFLDGMIESEFDRPWIAQTSVHIARKPELVKKMKEAGCFLGCFGFEGVTDVSLDDINKKQSVEDIKKAIDVFHQNDLLVLGMLIAGMRTDTVDIFGQISRFTKEYGIDLLQLLTLTPLPGSRIRGQYNGRILNDNPLGWRAYDGLHALIEPENMTAIELQEGIIGCYRDFYNFREGVGGLVESFRKKSTNRFPRYPAYMRFAGKFIVNSWLKNKDNKNYLEYLKKLE